MIFLFEKKVLTGLWELLNNNQLFWILWEPTLWELIQNLKIYIHGMSLSV
jgi:hypothetical protein